MFRAISIVSLLAPFLAFAVPQKFEAKGGGVEALVIGKPSLLKIRAKGEPAIGSLVIDGKKVNGSFEFELKTLDSGISLRDDHMLNRYLKVGEHPKATLVIKDLQLAKEFSAANPEVSETDFTGDLTLHGVTKPVKGKFKVGEKRNVSADFKVTLSEFSIDIPTYMGITVADEVNISVAIEDLKSSAN